MNLQELTNAELAALIREASALLAARLAGIPAPVETAAPAPSGPSPEEKDFALGVARFLRSGGNVTAGDRDRIADIATRHADWIRRQGLPTERGTWAWRKLAERNRIGRAKER